MAENDVDNELLDYEDDEVETAAGGDGAEAPAKKDVKGSYVSIHSSGFRDFLLKPELLRAIVDCGFEHPSEGNFSLQCRVLVRLLKTVNNRHVHDSLDGSGLYLGWTRSTEKTILAIEEACVGSFAVHDSMKVLVIQKQLLT